MHLFRIAAFLPAATAAVLFLCPGCSKDDDDPPPPGPGAQAAWFDVSPTGVEGTDFPVGRQRHALAYDSTRDVTVLFGGEDASAVLRQDTWEWNGIAWTDVSPGGSAGVDYPTARRGAALAFDASRNVVVLFGGDDGSIRDDTWVWNGTAWTEVSPGGTAGVDFPGAREDHAMAYDAVNGVVVLFGGDGGPSLDDTWTWNGTVWTDLSPGGVAGVDYPEARSCHAMAYVTGRNAVTLFGGNGGSALKSDTWEWNGTTWTDASPPGAAGTDFPDARRRHGIAHDSSRGVAVLFGGDNGATRLSDTWEWSGTGWARTAASGAAGVDFPTGRNFHAVAFDSARNAVVLFGGYAGGSGPLSDTWEYK